MVRVQLEIIAAERDRFVRQAEREGKTLEAWLIAPARRQVAHHEAPPQGETAAGDAGQSILEMFDEIHRSMPDDAFDELPTDGAANLKHYLYGWPRGEER